jgi:glucoamylase
MKQWIVALVCLFGSSNAWGKEAFGHPGVQHNWSNAKKELVGTSYSPDSLIWFSSSQGILTETYFPTIDKAQIKDSQLLVSDGKNLFVEDKTLAYDVVHHSATDVRIRKKHKDFVFERQFFTLNHHQALIEQIDLEVLRDDLRFYLLVNPSINGTGAYDSAYATANRLYAKEDSTELQVYTDVGFKKTSVGFVGFSDGYQDLNSNLRFEHDFTKAENGNVALSAELNIPKRRGKYRFYIVYQFDKGVLDFSQLELSRDLYHQQWQNYLNDLNKPQASQDEIRLYERSLVVLKTHEDKLNPGAFIASLSKPWGEQSLEDPQYASGGYHLIWPRDLYHIASAMMLAGDQDAAMRALNFLRKIQYKDGVWEYGARKIPRKGAFPQNTWTDRRDYWSGFQLDQTAYPVHLFYRLWLAHPQPDRFKSEYEVMVRSALDFIVNHGPWSAQERWEENFGISPSSFAAAAAALQMGYEVFKDSRYFRTANQWLHKPGDNIHTWTFTESGIFGNGKYYLRVVGCDGMTGQWNPNANTMCHVANSSKHVNQKEFLDQGFLQLGILGLVPADDARMLNSLNILNQHIRVKTPKGDGWYRYSHDAYGEDQKGRLWPLLSSEHARFAIERSKVGNISQAEKDATLHDVIRSYVAFANKGLMLPEQVFEHSGEGTGAATPLAWSHAEYLKTLWSKELDWNVENFFSR